MKKGSTNSNEFYSVSEVLDEFRRKDYSLVLRREADCLYCLELDLWILPENFNVDSFYYFEAATSPDADRIIYAITSSQGLKGFLVDTCSVYVDNISHEMFQKLQ